MPRPDVRERFSRLVSAPAPPVLDAACGFDLQGVWLARTIFRTRERLMGVTPPARRPRGILDETLSLGWGVLYRDDRLVIAGARCQPWLPDVTFTAIPPERFAAFAEPGQVKIAWTLEAEPIAADRTRFSHETRVVATDEAARQRFRRYWRWAGFGIVGIRYLMMPAVGRQAEARWAAMPRSATMPGCILRARGVSRRSMPCVAPSWC
jgi:hypothetical protein